MKTRSNITEKLLTGTFRIKSNKQTKNFIEEYTNCHEGLMMCYIEEYTTVLNYVNM